VDILERKTDLIQRLLKELTKQNARLAEADATIERIEKLLEEAEAVMVPVAAMLGWSAAGDGMHDWIMSKDAYLAERTTGEE